MFPKKEFVASFRNVWLDTSYLGFLPFDGTQSQPFFFFEQQNKTKQTTSNTLIAVPYYLKLDSSTAVTLFLSIAYQLLSFPLCQY